MQKFGIFGFESLELAGRDLMQGRRQAAWLRVRRVCLGLGDVITDITLLTHTHINALGFKTSSLKKYSGRQ